MLFRSQRAQCAAEVAKLRRGDVGRGRPVGGSDDLSIDDAAKAFSVSAPSVKRAKHVADKGDKATIEAVKAGEITVSAAAKLVDAVPDKKEQRKIVKEGRKAVAAKIKEGKPDKKRRSKKADGGAEPVTSGPLAGLEPDPVGVSSDDPPQDRITWLLAQLELLWSDYQAMFRPEADWWKYMEDTQ